MKLKKTYIWQLAGWPQLIYDTAAVADALQTARLQAGQLQGQLAAIGLARQLELSEQFWIQEALATAAIEGESLDMNLVRSSV